MEFKRRPGDPVRLSRWSRYYRTSRFFDAFKHLTCFASSFEAVKSVIQTSLFIDKRILLVLVDSI